MSSVYNILKCHAPGIQYERCVNVMAKDGEGAPWLQPFLGRHLYESGRRRDQGPTALSLTNRNMSNFVIFPCGYHKC
jgi:hypothetical protein